MLSVISMRLQENINTELSKVRVVVGGGGGRKRIQTTEL